MADPFDANIASRRDALGLGVLGLGAAALAAAGAATATPASAEPTKIPIEFDNPIWNRETSARLQANTNGEQVFGHCTGTVCGVRPGEAVRPILGFEVFSTIRVMRQADGSYQRVTREAIFYTDPKTGDILDEWDNPYTGERVKVVDVHNDPYNWIIASTFQPPAMPGVVTTGQATPGGKPYLLDWSWLGPDTVVLTTDYHGYYPNLLNPAHWPRESSGPMIQSSELFRYFINKKELEDPKMTFLPANGSWVRVQPWLPWMLMGPAPGHIMYDGVFRANPTPDYIPAKVLDRIKSKYPSFMNAPTKWYGPNYSSLEHYTMEQKPAPPK